MASVDSAHLIKEAVSQICSLAACVVLWFETNASQSLKEKLSLEDCSKFGGDRGLDHWRSEELYARATSEPLGPPLTISHRSRREPLRAVGSASDDRKMFPREIRV